MTVSKNPTIYDVATEAGVSVKTVSRVINNDKTVKAVNVAKVNQAIAKLDFKPDLNARRLRSKQSYQVALLYREYAGNFYSNMVTSGAIEVCDELGYDLIARPFNHNNLTRLPELINHVIARSNPDGFIVIPPLSEDAEMQDILAAAGKPVVNISPLHTGDVSFVNCNETAAARSAVQHLIELGHTRIGMVNYLVGHAAGEMRYQGYKQAHEIAGISMEEGLIVQREYDMDSIQLDIRKMLTAAHRPTAIFAFNDYLATVVYRIASQLKLRIPYDLAVVGFDDDPLAEYLWPPLTTVKQPIRELGKAAARQLICGDIQRQQLPPFKALDCELVIRNSTGPLL